MRLRFIHGLTGVSLAGLLALTAPGWILAQGQDQPQDQAPAGQVSAQDVMVGHALAMAIEGSTLLLSARQAVTLTDETVTPARRTTTEPSRRARDATDPSRRPPTATEPGRRAQDPTWQGAQHLSQHAQNAFRDSDRLFQQASGEMRDDAPDSPSQRFYTAAQQYANTLQAISEHQSGPGRQPLAGAARRDDQVVGARVRDEPPIPATRPEAARTDTSWQLTAEDATLIMLANHAVKEALDACKLRQMAHLMGEAPNDDLQMLRQHAQEMEQESRQLIQTLLTMSRERPTGDDPSVSPRRRADRPAARAGQTERRVDPTERGARPDVGARATTRPQPPGDDSMAVLIQQAHVVIQAAMRLGDGDSRGDVEVPDDDNNEDDAEQDNNNEEDDSE